MRIAIALALFLLSDGTWSASGRDILALIQAREFRQAIRQAEAWTQASPKMAEAWLWFARAQIYQAQNSNPLSAWSYAKSAKDAYERAIALDPSEFRAQFDLILYYLAAPAVAGGGRDKAEALAARIAELDPAQGHRARALLLQAERNLSGAEQALRQALSLRPTLIEAWVALIGVVGGSDPQAPDVAAQQRVLSEALAVLPDHLELLYQRGRLAALSGQNLEQGLADLDRCLAASNPPEGLSIAGAHWRRGQILLKLHRKSEALSALERAVALAPRHKEMKTDLERARKS